MAEGGRRSGSYGALQRYSGASYQGPIIQEVDDTSEWDNSEAYTVPQFLQRRSEMTDVAFFVEKEMLYFLKALLQISSPALTLLLEKGRPFDGITAVALPGKRYNEVAFFLQQLHPVLSTKAPITDSKLRPLLALAEEFQVDHVKTKCEQFISNQLQTHSTSTSRLTTSQVLTYLTACDRHGLSAEHREVLFQLAVNKSTNELETDPAFTLMTPSSMRDVLLKRCQKLEVENLKLPNANQRQRDRQLLFARVLAIEGPPLSEFSELDKRVYDLFGVHDRHKYPRLKGLSYDERISMIREQKEFNDQVEFLLDNKSNTLTYR